MPTTYYDVLGVDADADQDAIRDAYREKVKENHPDVSDHPDAEERFKHVKRAEIVLTDPEERETYDRLGHEAYVNGDDPEPNRPSEDEVRWAAARAAEGNHDAGGGRSAGWRDRERRARRAERVEWFGGAGDDASEDPFGDPFDTGSGNGAGDRTTASSAGPSAQRSATDGWGTANGASPGHSVHEWSPAQQRVGIPRPDWTQDDVVLLASSILLYPILLFLTAIPAFPTVARAAIGICAIALVAFLLPRPAFGIPVFGTWSIVLPAVIVGVGVAPLSVMGIVLLGGTWLPLGYSIAVAMVLVR
ncbi:hypothetical protein GCM10028857_07220 [Salinarchaeum chitinilyticum]